MATLSRTILLLGLGLLGMCIDAAAQIVVTPGSAAAFVRKPARSGVLVDSTSTTTTTTTTSSTTTTTVDQCSLAQASAALGSCCTAANNTHSARGRATYNAFTFSYSALGSGTSLGSAAISTTLRKTNADYWDKVGSCS